MTAMRRSLPLCLLALCLLRATAFAADPPPTVAVLYFDNNSPNREYDVLQKGLADMLVTDLSQVESLQVVEREKLQALVFTSRYAFQVQPGKLSCVGLKIPPRNAVLRADYGGVFADQRLDLRR